MNQQAKQVRCPELENRELREILYEAREVLQDHLIVDTADLNPESKVQEALERFRQRGGKEGCTAAVAANITSALDKYETNTEGPL